MVFLFEFVGSLVGDILSLFIDFDIWLVEIFLILVDNNIIIVG